MSIRSSRNVEYQTPDVCQAFVLSQIQNYQKKSDHISIHRCPFKRSCSNYAEFAIRYYGLVPGLVVFLDRYLYRENIAARHHYPRSVSTDGRLLLDDEWFLPPPQNDIEIAVNQEHISRNQSGFLIKSNTMTVIGDSSTAWADALYLSRDYENAALAYRYAAFATQDVKIKNQINYQITRCYLASENYSKAMIWGTQCVVDAKDSIKLSRSITMLGIIYELQHLSPLAEIQFRNSISIDGFALAMAGMGLVYAEQRNWILSKQWFDSAAKAELNEFQSLKFQNLSNYLQKSEEIPKISEATCATLSALLPGAGQIYSGHSIDGIQAFLAVATFSLATWSAWRYEHQNDRPYYGAVSLGTVTLTLYTSNVWGGWRTATFHNAHQEELFIKSIREGILNAELALPPL